MKREDVDDPPARGWGEAMGLFRRKQSASWETVRPHFEGEEREIDAANGWLLGASVGDSVDHPCSVFLTDRALYVDIRPQTMLPDPELLVAPFPDVMKCDIGPNDGGGTRLVFVFDPTGRRDADEVRGIAVDLPRGRRGSSVGRLIVDTVGAPGA